MSNHIRHKLNSSTELELADINTEETSLKNIDPNLDNSISNVKILTVNESYIPSLRALGTNLRNLTVLKIPHCGVRDLDGLSMCQNIKEIYLPFNEIVTIASIMFLTKLEVVDFESNNIASISEIDYLSILSNLKLLIFLNNPITEHSNYKEVIQQNVPNLHVLDDDQQNSSLKEEISSGKGQKKQETLKKQVKDFEKISNELSCGPNLLYSSKIPTRPQTAFPLGRNNNTNFTIKKNNNNTSTCDLTTYRESQSPLSKVILTNSNSMSSGYSQLTTGNIMAGSAARSLRSRDSSKLTNRTKSAKSSGPVNVESTVNGSGTGPGSTNILTFSGKASNSGTNTDDLGYIRPNLEEQKALFEKRYGLEQFKFKSGDRPATSYNNRSKTSLGTNLNHHQSSSHKVGSNGDTSKKLQNGNELDVDVVERELANVEDETDALLRELQEWRVQHHSVLENIKKTPKPNEPLQLEKHVMQPIPPKKHYEAARISQPPSTSQNTSSISTSISDPSNPNNYPIKALPPRSPEDSASSSKKISSARMRQFQRRSNQHKSSQSKQSSRDRSLTIEKPIINANDSATTSPQQLVNN